MKYFIFRNIVWDINGDEHIEGLPKNMLIEVDQTLDDGIAEASDTIANYWGYNIISFDPVDIEYNESAQISGAVVDINGLPVDIRTRV